MDSITAGGFDRAGHFLVAFIFMDAKLVGALLRESWNRKAAQWGSHIAWSNPAVEEQSLPGAAMDRRQKA